MTTLCYPVHLVNNSPSVILFSSNEYDGKSSFDTDSLYIVPPGKASAVMGRLGNPLYIYDSTMDLIETVYYKDNSSHIVVVSCGDRNIAYATEFTSGI